MSPLVLDLFSGPGGWDLGARALGLDPIGVELDETVCRTRAAAGLRTIRADVAALPVEHLAGRVAGLIASPPCQSFSAAGKGAGQRDMDLIQRAAHVLACGLDIGYLRCDAEDPRSLLVLEPLRWARDTRPEWVALEQVPPVLGLWRRYAEVLRGWGYSTWTGLLNSADHGVVSACPLHATDWPTDPAEAAERLSRCATALATAERLATTVPDEAWIAPALTAVARLVRATTRACAAAATHDERAKHLAAFLEREARPTPPGAAAEPWTSEATSTSAWTADTAVSIASSLSSYLGDLWSHEKSSTTSTGTRRTTIRRILRCIAATLTTGPGTGPASREAGCGLCVDLATPQTRVRAILMASRTRRVKPPEPTHSDQRRGGSLLGLQPWVSMSEALGWGWDDTPAGTVCGHRGPRWGYEAGDGTGRVLVRTGSGNGDAHDYERDQARPAPSVTGRADRWTVSTSNSTKGGTRPGGLTRSAGEPAHTVDSRAGQWTLRTIFHGRAWDRSIPRTADQPAPTLSFGHAVTSWAFVGQDGDERKLTLQEAAVLQGFEPDYPFAGNKTQRFQQVGDAFPPPVAAAVIRALTGGTS